MFIHKRNDSPRERILIIVGSIDSGIANLPNDFRHSIAKILHACRSIQPAKLFLRNRDFHGICQLHKPIQCACAEIQAHGDRRRIGRNRLDQFLQMLLRRLRLASAKRRFQRVRFNQSPIYLGRMHLQVLIKNQRFFSCGIEGRNSLNKTHS